MKKSSKNYFTIDTENAIIEYNKTDDSRIKNRIYSEKIHHPLFKLTQNIIHTFKFYYTEETNIEDLQHELIIFLISKFYRYNHRRNIQERFTKIITKEFNEEYNDNFEEYVGDVDRVTQDQIDSFIDSLNITSKCKERLRKITPPKAYSYFGTITKRWLISYNDKNYKNRKNRISVDSIKENNEIDHNLIYEKDKSVDKLYFFIDEYVKYCDENLYNIFPPKIDKKTKELTFQEEVQIADAILQLFKKRDSIDIFNKKALYIYIREIIDVKTPKITKVANILSDIFNRNYLFYLEHNYIKFE
jgi:hypothetical protein